MPEERRRDAASLWVSFVTSTDAVVASGVDTGSCSVPVEAPADPVASKRAVAAAARMAAVRAMARMGRTFRRGLGVINSGG
ncbi:hypothetical protein Aglo03_49980 [Actinokineospora globicatena]|uniref:Uncharacterized protein n=1 Tax=Actinokineospora globicatena TaxID=103729 RepID=A0A9W6QR83_9PSEU|nr:hypothetical protein Aglo03_49980 [Actinokineospora globicatena]